MAPEEPVPCPHCGAPMAPIFIVDKADHMRHEALEYTLPSEKPSFWTGRFPIKGTVASIMCSGCGYIILKGVPKK